MGGADLSHAPSKAPARELAISPLQGRGRGARLCPAHGGIGALDHPGSQLRDVARHHRDPTREVYVARDETGLAGFLILCMTGAFVGYIQTICIDPDRRGQGLGSRLVEFAEQRILQVSPNVFMCVSSFNHGARRLYERLGYKVVGELTDYIVRGPFGDSAAEDAWDR